MKYLLPLLLFFGMRTAEGQNLVSNPGFETYTECPVMNIDDIQIIANWHSLAGHYGSPDYFNVCADPRKGSFVPTSWMGYQVPYDGKAYIGIFAYDKSYISREYMQTRLTSPLVAGKRYRISFFTSLANESAYGINNIGVVLSNDSVVQKNNTAVMALTPVIKATEIITDTVNWTLVTGIYKANGGEQFLLLGNFNTDEETSIQPLYNTTGGFAYYFIDAVSVLSIDGTACDFTVYPNPATGRIDINSACQTFKEVSVYSAIGQLVKRITGDIRSVDLGNLPTGLYLVVATTTENKRLVKKIIKSSQ